MTTLSLACILAEAARLRPQKIGVVDGDARVTFADLWAQALRFSGGLTELGIGPGDHVALMCPNVVEFPRGYFGVLATGAVVVPVHLLYTPEEIAYVLRDSGAKLLLCHSSQLAAGVAAAAAAGVPVVAIGPLPAEMASQFTRLEDVSQRVDPPASYFPCQAEDPAVVLYTSGTTGQSKGAVLTQLNLVMNATIAAFDTNDTRSDDVVLGCLPLFHTFGQTVSMNGAFRIGSTLVMLPRFSGAAAIDLMIKEKVTSFQGVPMMYIGLMQAAAGRIDLPQLRLCVSGGAALPTAVLERFAKTFGATIYEGYGLSETSPTATANQPQFGNRAGTVGHAVWGVEVEIARADVEGRIDLLPPGELGEVVVRGHNVFAGYLGRPEETAKAMVDSWFRTGDLGTKDATGFVTIVDRKKDVIIRGGFNVYPTEIEQVLAQHPAVAQVAVIGVPDELHGEEIMAVVVPRDGFPPDEEFLAWAREHLGRHMYPRKLVLMKELPVGPSMKVLKRELRRTLSAESGGLKPGGPSEPSTAQCTPGRSAPTPSAPSRPTPSQSAHV